MTAIATQQPQHYDATIEIITEIIGICIFNMLDQIWFILDFFLGIIEELLGEDGD